MDSKNIYWWYAQPASNLGSISARQRDAVQMAFCLRADSGPILRDYWVLAG